ncbi:MAG: hypothetical protein ACRCZY_06315 [Phocaeicola sp.]
MIRQDLTTKKGIMKALLFGNPLFMAMKIGKKLIETDSVENQCKEAVRLIEQGKKEEVDEMEIKVSRKAGLRFNAPIEGCDIKVEAGSNAEMTIKVKYK